MLKVRILLGPFLAMIFCRVLISLFKLCNSQNGYLLIGCIVQEFKYICLMLNDMSQSRQLTASKYEVPKLAIIALAAIFVVGLFVVGFDQGHLFSPVFGEQAFEDLYIHELTHDMRHAAGFPCH